MARIPLNSDLTALQNCPETRGLFSASEFEHAKRTLVDLLNATTVVRSPKRNPDGSVAYIEKPDNPTRLTAAVKLLELEAGRAPQAFDIRTTPARSQGAAPQDLMQMARAHPKLVKKIFDQFIAATRVVEPVEHCSPHELPGVDSPTPATQR